jgi:hypothetical protein
LFHYLALAPKNLQKGEICRYSVSKSFSILRPLGICQLLGEFRFSTLFFLIFLLSSSHPQKGPFYTILSKMNTSKRSLL